MYFCAPRKHPSRQVLIRVIFNVQGERSVDGTKHCTGKGKGEAWLKCLMGPEKAISLRRESWGREVGSGMIGWKEV